jgi:hypothetical protein
VALNTKLEAGDLCHALLPLSSWTTSFDEAKKHSFTNLGICDLEFSYVLEKEFPIDRILCTGHTGLGTIHEKEYVVLGPQNDVDKIRFTPTNREELN